MGCGASTPVKDEPPKKGKETSAASHANFRSKDSSQAGPSLYVGPDYKKLKHLGKSLLPYSPDTVLFQEFLVCPSNFFCSLL